VPDLCTLVACDEVLLFCQSDAYNKIPWNDALRSTLLALSAETGKVKWEAPCGNWGYGSPADVFVTGGRIWVHGATGYTLLGLDPATGEVKEKHDASEAMDGAHHHRCYRNKASTHFVMTSRRGVETIDVRSGENRLHHWVRGACRYGILPCNGLIYAPPDPCMCYAMAKVNGLLALASRRASRPAPDAAKRLVRGSAFGKIEAGGDGEGWPTYRHDARRSGSTDAAIPAKLVKVWSAKVGGGVSSLTAADGRVYAASADTHAVHALEAATGHPVWRFTAGGPVDTPPTLHKGMVLFGSADGRVYCLRASDGALAWRFRAAPAETRVSAFGHIVSPWPVHGSVLIRDGRAFVTAGRSSFLDGGIRLCVLDPATGKVLQEGVRYAPDPETGKGRFNATLRYDMPPDHPGALSDILVSEGSHIYMRHTRIDPADVGRDLEADQEKAKVEAFYKEKQTGKVLRFGPQITSTSGLLDDAWFNQTFWSFANASHARLLVFDAQRTYGVKAYGGGASRHTRGKYMAGSGKYTIFADDRQRRKRSWSLARPLRVTALVAAGDSLIVAGTPDRIPSDDPWAAHEGRAGALLRILSKSDGKPLAEYPLASPPVWDGMAVAGGRLFISTKAGDVLSYGGVR
jgi:outer membrane protein assembly factor BamB